MFKVGDKVVCINNDYFLQKDLILHKIYTVESFKERLGYLRVCEINMVLDIRRFVLLKEYRKQKLSKIIKDDQL